MVIMEALLQEESHLEAQIDLYKNQLSQIEAQCGEDASLQQLQSDLSQLISLTEESLLELKKHKLLLMIQGEGDEQTSAAPDQVEAHPQTIVDDDENPDAEGMERLKCRAPLQEAWGAINYHNAVVISSGMDSDTEGDSKVHVLFTQPLYDKMKPCPYYLEASCKFSDDKCKFSHGHSVAISELQPYQEFDYSLAHVGGKCLAKYKDDLWYPGIISAVGEQFTVHFSSINTTVQVEPDCVQPLESSDESEISSSDSSSDAENGDDTVRYLGWMPKEHLDHPLAEWEKHTTGIGSKLLAKMGYVVGQGLGKSNQGRVEPVEIVVLPTGKSLDVCAEMREANKLRKAGERVTHKKKRRRKKKKEQAGEFQGDQHEQKTDMFDFLNTKIFRKSDDKSDKEKEELAQKSRRKSSAGSENLNVKLFKTQEDIKNLKKRKQSLQQSLLRHKERKDKQLEAHAQEKLVAVNKQLAMLQREEQTIQKGIKTKSEHKKLTVF